MTETELQIANKIQQTLKEVTEAKHAIMAYHNERVELDITLKKGLLNYATDDNTTKHYTLRSYDPLFVAIAATLEGIREELQEQFDNIGRGKSKCYTEKNQGVHPIAKTSWWQKAFRWSKPK